MTLQQGGGTPATTGDGSRIITSHDEAMARARALVPALRERAEGADKARRVLDESIRQISAAGLFRILAPKEFGGSQLGLASLVGVGAELASGCGSTGWLFNVLAGHNWLLSLFPITAQAEFFANPDNLAASIVKMGGEKPVREAGGFRIRNAVGKFCSGIDHASWIVLGVGVERDDGSTEPFYMLVPKDEVEIVDDWFTTGLRGTGSRSLRVADAFVPEYRCAAIGDMLKGVAPGTLHHDVPLYRAPFPQILPLVLAGAPLGLGRAGVDVFVERFAKKISGWPDDQIGEQAAFFLRITEASADVDGAFALVLKDCRDIDALADGTKASEFERARYMRNIAHAAYRCRMAVNSLFEASGGSGIYEGHELQRIWRDINSAAAHNSFVRERAAGMFGRAVLGLPPSKFDRIGS